MQKSTFKKILFKHLIFLLVSSLTIAFFLLIGFFNSGYSSSFPIIMFVVFLILISFVILSLTIFGIIYVISNRHSTNNNAQVVSKSVSLLKVGMILSVFFVVVKFSYFLILFLSLPFCPWQGKGGPSYYCLSSVLRFVEILMFIVGSIGLVLTVPNWPAVKNSFWLKVGLVFCILALVLALGFSGMDFYKEIDNLF